MQQDTATQLSETRPIACVTLLTAQREIDLSRGTLKKYLTYLGIKPICFHISTRSSYISRQAMAHLKHFKENLSVLASLNVSVVEGTSEKSREPS